MTAAATAVVTSILASIGRTLRIPCWPNISANGKGPNWIAWLISTAPRQPTNDPAA